MEDRIEYTIEDIKIKAYRHERDNRWECYVGNSPCNWIEGDKRALSEGISRVIMTGVKSGRESIERQRARLLEIENIALDISKNGIEKVAEDYQTLQLNFREIE